MTSRKFRAGRYDHAARIWVTVRPSAAEAVRHGHPWVYREGLDALPTPCRAGDEVSLRDERGDFLGRGLIDPESPLCVRMWTRKDRAVDPPLVEERVRHALRLRESFHTTDHTTAYRLLHGEGDRVPGFVVDRYGAVAILKCDGEAARARCQIMIDVLRPLLEPLGIVALYVREGGRGEAPHLEKAWGSDMPLVTTVLEHGVPMVVDLEKGQKTGAFLDQRENRRRVGTFAKGRRVLNLFSYAGGFSLHAALGGAAHVTSVDIASAAHATAQSSFRAAGLDPTLHSFVSADAFLFLEEAKKKGRSWDLIVCDPPSFAPNERSLKRALAAYRQLHRGCADVLSPQGLFCAASCSSHVDARLFASTLDDGTLGRDDLRVLQEFGAPWDHPTLPAWPEGRYLKFFVLG